MFLTTINGPLQHPLSVKVDCIPFGIDSVLVAIQIYFGQRVAIFGHCFRKIALLCRYLRVTLRVSIINSIYFPSENDTPEFERFGYLSRGPKKISQNNNV